MRFDLGQHHLAVLDGLCRRGGAIDQADDDGGDAERIVLIEREDLAPGLGFLGKACGFGGFLKSRRH